MAQLFEINEVGEIDLNKEWIRLNPIMNKILTRDKGSKGDTQGKDKKQASKEFNYIRMMWSPNSEYESYPEKQRRTEVLKVLDIHVRTYDADEDLQAAEQAYRDFLKNLRSYRAWKAATSSLDAKIDYLENYDPNARDKQQGRLLLTPEQHTKAIKSIRDDLETIDAYKNMMDKEISQEIATRQTLRLGLRENRSSDFKEGNHFA